MILYRFMQVTAARILLCLIGTMYVCSSLTWANEWGERAYHEEVGEFDKQKAQITRQINQKASRLSEVRNQLQAYLAPWSKKDRAKAFNWFESEYQNARAFKGRYRESRKKYEKAAENYKERYKELYTIDETLDEKVNLHARNVLWSSELRMLKLKLVAMSDELRYRDLELHAIKAYEDIYWTEFFYDTMDDMQYIFRSYVDSLSDEFFGCFLNTATAYGKSKMLKRPLPQIGVGFGSIDKSGQVYLCAKDITLNSIVNALESASRKQFVDNMEDSGIETEVAEFWWTDYVMPKAAKMSRTHKALRHYFSLKFLKTQLKDEAKGYLQKRLYIDIKENLINQLKTLGPHERYGDNAKKLIEKTAKDRAAQHIAMQALEAAEFTVKYGERALLIYYNQAGFENIATDLIHKRRIIKECLRRKKRPDHAPAIISVFKYNAQGWTDFLRDCRESERKEKTDRHPLSGCQALIGNWTWFNGARVNCGEGTCTASNGFTASWECTDPSGRFTIRWNGPTGETFIDTVNVRGNSLQGSNQNGNPISATRR